MAEGCNDNTADGVLAAVAQDPKSCSYCIHTHKKHLRNGSRIGSLTTWLLSFPSRTAGLLSLR